MELTNDKIENILAMKYIDASTTGYTLPVGMYEISDVVLMLSSLLPDDVKVKFTFDDVGMRSNWTTNKTIRFTKKFSYNTLFYSIPFRITGWYWKICSINSRII